VATVGLCSSEQTEQPQGSAAPAGAASAGASGGASQHALTGLNGGVLLLEALSAAGWRLCPLQLTQPTASPGRGIPGTAGTNWTHITISDPGV